MRAEAAARRYELELLLVLTLFGTVHVRRTSISHLMSWRELDVMLLAGADFGPQNVMQLISRILELPGIVGFDYRDERAARSPTGQARDERYHVPILFERPAGIWRLDLTLWLHDIHDNVTAWHQALRDSITHEERAAVLRIKDVWFRLPTYPDQIGGLEIYTAVTEGGVRTPEEFDGWLADRKLPGA